jgi:hypothetical protein
MRRTSSASSPRALHNGVPCTVCHLVAAETESVALWREGVLVFSICHTCMGSHDIVMRPSATGVEVQAKLGARLQGGIGAKKASVRRIALSRVA